jgi:hypothetical protein
MSACVDKKNISSMTTNVPTAHTAVYLRTTSVRYNFRYNYDCVKKNKSANMTSGYEKCAIIPIIIIESDAENEGSFHRMGGWEFRRMQSYGDLKAFVVIHRLYMKHLASIAFITV